jgi:hypothetical protein
LAPGFCALGLALLAAAVVGLMGQVGGFFGAGASLLIGLLLSQANWLRRERRRTIHGQGWTSVARLGFRNVSYRPGRSILCIALIASATFIVVAVDAFRREPASAVDRNSGTGGYQLLAESMIPIVHDPNTPEGREALNLSSAREAVLDNVRFTRFRVRPGDDASCLNLYQPRNPRILGAPSSFIQSGRFSFQDSLARTPEEKANPWLLLDEQSADGAIPVIADANSMTYVLHKKLGDELIISPSEESLIRLRFVAALSDSVFQSELIVSEMSFLRLFPEREGYKFFLIETRVSDLGSQISNPDSQVSNASGADGASEEKRPAAKGTGELTGVLEEQLSDFGFDVVPVEERLEGFHRVENTYLSTFQSLGALGLVLGTVGLAAVLLRNVLERRKELALLKAVGYRQAHLAIMVIAENGVMLVSGLVIGTLCAALAIAPAFLSRGGEFPFVSFVLMLTIVVLVGTLAALGATLLSLRSPLLPALRSE